MREVGEKADIQVSDDEVTQALVERVRQYPGQEREVWEFYQKNPQALAEIRAPLFEEKVVDHVLAQVKVVEEPVSKEALLATTRTRRTPEPRRSGDEAGSRDGVR